MKLSTPRPEAIVISLDKTSSSSPVIQSPVPLSQEEEGSAEVRALAAALAPTLVAADQLLQGTMDMKSVDGTTTGHSSSVADDFDYDNDDDDLDDEVEALGASEALLRQELDLAHDFSKLFAFSVIESPTKEGYNEPDTIASSPVEANPQKSMPVPSSHITASAVDDDSEDDEVVVCLDKKLEPIPITQPIRPLATAPATPDRQGPTDDSFFASSPLSSRRHSEVNNTIHYTPRDHCQVLGLRREEHGGWYSVSLTKFLVSLSASSTAAATSPTFDIHEDVKEFCLAMPEVKLRQLYTGLPEPRVPSVTDDSKSTTAALVSSQAALPVRTIAMRIRPDVLCGAVMEAVHHTLTELNAKVIKRQGGHIQAIVGRAFFSGSPEAVRILSEPQPQQSYVAYHVDARLLTHKSDHFERTLILRVYHVSASTSENEADEVDNEKPNADDLVTSIQDEALNHPVRDTMALHLREAAALIQRMEAPHAAKGINPRTDSRNMTREACSETVSTHLVDHYRACPSVKDGGITLPALNAEDYTIIQSSWRVVQAVYEELETRDLAFTTLRSRRFGSFPSLPTLDVHYCAQIRRISREAMTARVVKTAFGLEHYAREAELECANLISLLKPMFVSYGVDAPPLPKPKQLTDYPLDYTVPQASCPPWGDKVQHALNEIQAWTGDANSKDPISFFPGEQSIDEQKSLDLTNSAVQLVVEAFRKQDDEEQSARLGRKNIQVMDRLARMQIHQNLSIQTIQNCVNVSEKAVLAASDFQTKTGVREVPLLKCSIVVGHSKGTCTVTANHILFSTQLIPVLGGISKTLFSLDVVEFVIATSSAATSVLKPNSAPMRVLEQGQEVYSCRPVLGSSRLKSFLDVVKAAQYQIPLDIPVQDVAPIDDHTLTPKVHSHI